MYGDNVSGFTIVKGAVSEYWSILHGANSLHLKRNEQYTMLLRKLQADGVAFKDIQKRLLNVAKADGIYKKSKGPWCAQDATGSYIPEYRPYKQLRSANVAWAVALGNFLTWKARNWSDYDTPVIVSEKPKPKKHSITVNIRGEERKVTLRNISEDEWDEYIATISGDAEEMAPETIENLIKSDVVYAVALLHNVLEERGLDVDDEIGSLITKIESPPVPESAEVAAVAVQ